MPSGASACDASAITAGIPSRALMQRAGAASAAELRVVTATHSGRGVVVIATGPGEQRRRRLGRGALPSRRGRRRCSVVECVAARTADAVAERDVAQTLSVAWTDDVSAICSPVR